MDIVNAVLVAEAKQPHYCCYIRGLEKIGRRTESVEKEMEMLKRERGTLGRTYNSASCSVGRLKNTMKNFFSLWQIISKHTHWKMNF